MRTLTGLVLGMAVFAGGYVVSVDQAVAAANKSHAHMGHVTKAWKDTPDSMGFLPTAIAEAKIAALHAGLAAKNPGDLGWMQTHANHILHALDASMRTKGPGLGYGVVKASSNVSKHINLAAKSADASDNVRAHAVQVAASSDNTAKWAKQMIALSKKVLTSGYASQAAALVAQIVTLSGQLLEGVDANGDGSISWHEGEGGLNEANKHMGFMEQGEGMS